MGLQLLALRNQITGPFTFDLATGECLVIQGPSGAGKSVLLRLIADLIPSQGSVYLDGIARETLPAAIWRKRVALVPAQVGWWCNTVKAHFALDELDRVRSLAAQLSLPVDAIERDIAHLSTGERQRFGLVRAMVANPDVFLLDEPTSALDPQTAIAVERLFRQQQERGAIVIWVTHDTAQALRVGNRIVHIARGRAVEA